MSLAIFVHQIGALVMIALKQMTTDSDCEIYLCEWILVYPTIFNNMCSGHE